MYVDLVLQKYISGQIQTANAKIACAYVLSDQGLRCPLPETLDSVAYINIGIKHGFSCINIHQVSREVLKTEAGGRGFQHLPRDLANVNALKNHV